METTPKLEKHQDETGYTRMGHSWDDIPVSAKAREKLLYGEDKPMDLTWDERLQRAKRVAALSPWGLELRTFPSPYYALIGGLEARRKMAGGPWRVKHWGETLSSKSLEELFLQVVERLDDVARPTTANPVVYSAFGEQKRSSFGYWDQDGPPDSLQYFPGTKSCRPPSERFYSNGR